MRFWSLSMTHKQNARVLNGNVTAVAVFVCYELVSSEHSTINSASQLPND
jgi:hypothetical protein